MTEDAFLQALFPALGPMPPEVVVPPGDDCAAIRVAPDRLLLLAVDQVIGDRHFHLSGAQVASPREAGRKLLARNLSDIAAMGGKPLYALVATAVPPDRDAAWLRAFMDGILDLARETGTVLIGGDLAQAPHDVVTSLTIVGEVAPACVCRRGGARPGDVFFATGAFGASLPTGHHLHFTPRLREGQWLANRGGVHAMMDVSDGLLLDAFRICRASGLRLRLDTAAIPLRTPQTSRQQALTDGEDYELILAVAPEAASQFLADWPFADVRLTRLGGFEAAPVPDVLDAATGGSLTAGQRLGFDHLAPAPA